MTRGKVQTTSAVCNGKFHIYLPRSFQSYIRLMDIYACYLILVSERIGSEIYYGRVRVGWVYFCVARVYVVLLMLSVLWSFYGGESIHNGELQNAHGFLSGKMENSECTLGFSFILLCRPYGYRGWILPGGAYVSGSMSGCSLLRDRDRFLFPVFISVLSVNVSAVVGSRYGRRPYLTAVVVVFTLNRSFYPTSAAAPPVSFLILHP